MKIHIAIFQALDDKVKTELFSEEVDYGSSLRLDVPLYEEEVTEENQQAAAAETPSSQGGQNEVGLEKFETNKNSLFLRKMRTTGMQTM